MSSEIATEEAVLSHYGLRSKRSQFVEPSPENPVRAQDLVAQMDLEFLRPVLEQNYVGGGKFRFDPLPMVRTMLYWRLSGHRFLTEVWNDLVMDPALADNMGFGDIPDYKTLYHWLNYRLGKEGVRRIFDVLLGEVITLAGQHGLKVGRELMIDSTPIEKKSMEQATYNPKYEMKCIKYHNLRCVRTGLPLDYHASTGTEYDGNLFVPLIFRAITIHGINPKRVFGDGHYSSADALMRLKEHWGIETICNIPKDWIIREDADRNAVQKAYQKLWKVEGFEPGADIEYQKLMLMLHDKTETLESFYHNQVLQKYQQDPEAYAKKLGVRSAIEHGHGLEKRSTELKNIQASNLDTFETHLGMHVISLLSLALVRLQNGITEGLIRFGGVV
jgi:hypothetical protein